MTGFFEEIDPDAAAEIDALARLVYELRENRRALLAPYGAEDEAGLLQQIEAGSISEHPAYEHYLAARILDNTRETVRALVNERLLEANRK
jgi:hypothetical protein